MELPLLSITGVCLLGFLLFDTFFLIRERQKKKANASVLPIILMAVFLVVGFVSLTWYAFLADIGAQGGLSAFSIAVGISILAFGLVHVLAMVFGLAFGDLDTINPVRVVLLCILFLIFLFLVFCLAYPPMREALDNIIGSFFAK